MEAAPRSRLIGPLPVFLAGWALQCALAAALPLVADEAYYLAWAQAPAMGYLDHPPGVAWWILLGFGHPRLPGLALMPVAWWLLADAARRWGVAGWRWVPALVVWTPLGVAAGVIATPDVPLVFAWCVVLWGCAARRGMVAGVAFGAALWAKSAALVALPGLALVLGRQAPAALVAAALVYAPHVAWSLANEGLPWSFQARRITGGASFHLPEALGGQLLVVTPGLFALAVAAWRRPADATERDLRRLSLPILLAWLAASLITRVEANWPALAWPAAVVLLLRRPALHLPRAALLAGGFTAAAALALPILHRTLPIGAGPPRDGEALRACYAAAAPLPPVAARYQEKALLDLAGPPVPYVRAADHRPSEYDRRFGPRPPPCDFVYLASARALGGRCAGATAELTACGRTATTCQCAQPAGNADTRRPTGLFSRGSSSGPE